jgi:hypothetical protein
MGGIVESIFGGGKSEDPPSPPPPPPPTPTPVDAEVVKKQSDEELKLRKRRGLGDTILTGQGLGETEPGIVRPTLLGG